MKNISTHAPLARCDTAFNFDAFIPTISTHAPLARCDLSRMPLIGWLAISTHAPLARCDPQLESSSTSARISTHAPLARCDMTPSKFAEFRKISTHAPLARCDLMFCTHFFTKLFQLTHLLRGATIAGMLLNAIKSDFNSRTSCEVRLSRGCFLMRLHRLSPHAPLARCDQIFLRIRRDR